MAGVERGGAVGGEAILGAACADLQDQLAVDRSQVFTLCGAGAKDGGSGSELQLTGAAVRKMGRGAKWRQGAQLGGGCRNPGERWWWPGGVEAMG